MNTTITATTNANATTSSGITTFLNATTVAASHVVTTQTEEIIHDLLLNHLPTGVLIASSIMTVLVCAFTLNNTVMWTLNLSHTNLKKLFSPMERKVSYVQYMVALPAFELFVIWGPHLHLSIHHSTSSSIITWLVVNCLSTIALVAAFFSVSKFLFLIHVSQSIRLPMAVMFFCDRFINSTIGVEGVFIAVMFCGSVYEMFQTLTYFYVQRAVYDVDRNATDFTQFDVEDDRWSSVKEVRDSFAKRDTSLQQMVRNTFNTDASWSTSEEGEFDNNVPHEARQDLRAQSNNATVKSMLSDIGSVNDNIEPVMAKKFLMRCKRRLTRLNMSTTDDIDETTQSSVAFGNASTSAYNTDEEKPF